jgi:lipoate-protein ligase A
MSTESGSTSERATRTMVPSASGPPLDTRWRVMVTPPASGSYNMAVDERLMAAARVEDCWIVRVYGWAFPTVSFGKYQAAASAYSPDAIRARHFDVVRRPTGGRAILHHREITYSVAAPLERAGELRQTYSVINQLLLAGLERLGVAARLSATGPRGIAPGMIPCFDHPSDGELVVGTRKLVGSAQWRSHDALLQHGSILIDDDQATLNALLLSTVEPPVAPPPAATLRQVLGTAPSLQDFADAMFGLIEARFADVTYLDVADITDQALRDLEDRYRSDEWTWRR